MNPNMRNDKIKKVFEDLGLKNVKPIIASGNFVFESSKEPVAIEKKIEAALPEKLGFKSTTIVRSKDDLEKLVKRDPYKGAEHGPKNYTLVTFLKKHSPKLRTLPREGPGFKINAIFKREVCITIDLKNMHTPDMMANAEKTLGKEITSRTWKTVKRIFEKMA